MIHDISTPLDAYTPVYSGDPLFTRRIESLIGKDGANYNLSSIIMSAHCGTHVDAPYHFIDKGQRIHEIPAHRWVSSALVLEVSGDRLITAETLKDTNLRPGDSLLLKANADRAAGASPDDFRAISTDAAEFLVERGINLIGIDSLSIEHYHDPGFPVHHILLGSGILILEGLRLGNIAPGRYTLIAAPLLITDGDGAPARALLIDE